MTEVADWELHSAEVLPKDLRTQAELCCAAALSADGVEPLAEQAQALIQEDAAPGLWHTWILDKEKLVAYGNLDARRIPALELVVHPLYRSHGYGSAILHDLLDKVAAAAASVPERDLGEELDTRPMVWSHGDFPPARQLARKFDLERSRELLKMQCRSFDLIVNLPELDPDIAVMTLAEADLKWGEDTLNEAMVEVNNEAFSWHPEQSGWTVDNIVEHRAESWFDSTECFVAMRPETGDLLGFAWAKTHYEADDQGEISTDMPTAGELYLVAVRRAAQGKHIGTVLTSLILRRLAAQGIPELILYVEGNNEPALRVYAESGFTVERCDVAYRVNAPTG